MPIFQEYKSSLKITASEEPMDLILFRPLAFFLVKGIASTRITPNQLTFAGILFFIAAGAFISSGALDAVFAAGLFICIGNILDCADGQLARVNKSGTEFGRILDGIGDYISAIALFIGIGLWGSTQSYDPLIWWSFVVLAGVAFGWQASLVDYYRNEFYSYFEGKDNFIEDEIESSKKKLLKIDNIKGNGFKRFMLSSYIFYSTMQAKMQPKHLKIDTSSSQQYVKNNLLILRLWCFNGSSTPKFLAVICCFYNRLDIFLLYILVFGTIWSLILLILQKKIDKELLISTT